MKKTYDAPEIGIVPVCAWYILSSSITGDADLPVIDDGPSFIY